MKTEKEYNDAEDSLLKAGWRYLGASEWLDPATNVKLPTGTAYAVMISRDRRENIQKNIKVPARKPRLVLCSDWVGIRRELRRQLKPFGLTVVTRANIKKWGDKIDWEVQRLAENSTPEDNGDEFYCWHKIPYGKGSYCTGCGGLIKKKI